MADTDYQLEAVKIAGEWSKQLGLWAAGTVALSVTFMKDILGAAPVSNGWVVVITISWVLLLVSILVGHVGFGAALTGAGTDGFSLRVNRDTRVFSIWQMSLFIVGVAGIVLFASAQLSAPHGALETRYIPFSDGVVLDKTTGDLVTVAKSGFFRTNLTTGKTQIIPSDTPADLAATKAALDARQEFCNSFLEQYAKERQAGARITSADNATFVHCQLVGK